MKIKIVSDLHLEFGPMALSVDGVDVLLAAGDIGVGVEGLEWLQQLPCKVLYVAGNHEYWGEDLPELKGRLAEAAQQGNVRFLENSSVVIGNVRFVGCTLWSDYNGEDSSIMAEMSLAMNDFRHINMGSRLLQPLDLVNVNKQSRRWLQHELRQPFEGKTVVLTHHAPLSRSWYRGNNDITQFAYCNNLEDLMGQVNIDLWIHGHVHTACDYQAHGVRVVCNPRGYVGYREVKGFDSEKCIEL
ncbi:MAG: metallophosphoesterase [Pseudomonadota bacterium]